VVRDGRPRGGEARIHGRDQRLAARALAECCGDAQGLLADALERVDQPDLEHRHAEAAQQVDSAALRPRSGHD
jgi:hypothetical protein